MVSPLTKKFERRSESIQREVRHIRRDSSLTKEEGSVFSSTGCCDSFCEYFRVPAASAKGL